MYNRDISTDRSESKDTHYIFTYLLTYLQLANL